MIEIDEQEFKEWHKCLLRERDRYKFALTRICSGSKASIPGMASEYVKMKREELMEIADKALEAFR